MKVKTNTHKRAEKYLKSKCREVRFEYHRLGWDFTCDGVKYLVLTGYKSRVVVPYLKLKEALPHNPKVLICFSTFTYETTLESILKSIFGDRRILVADGLKFRVLEVTVKTPPNWITLKIPVPIDVYKKFYDKVRLRGKLPDEIIRDFVSY